MHLNNPGIKKPNHLSCMLEKGIGPKPPCSLGLGHGKQVPRYQHRRCGLGTRMG